MKKVCLACSVAVILLLLIAFVVTGFHEQTDIFLTDFSVSNDNSELSFSVVSASSAGYTRGFADKGGGAKPHYLTFYSTFGGVLCPIGAKESFTLPLGENDTEIFFNRPDGGYELVLTKNPSTGEWQQPE